MTRCRLRTMTLSSDEARDTTNGKVFSLGVGGGVSGVAAVG